MKTTLKQSGISLIEILVVLVLLLVAIFSVVRMFPSGFLVNRYMENATLAMRLAKQEADRFAHSTGSLMDGIVPVYPKPTGTWPGYVWEVDQDATPDDISTAAAAVLGVDPYYLSDANKHRRVVGERVRIPIPTPTMAGIGSIYVLSSGPIYRPDPALGAAESISISGTPLFRLELDSGQIASDYLRGPMQYAIDYNSHQIAFFAVGYDRTFTLRYSYYDAGSKVQTVLGDTLVIPAGDDGWKNIASPGGGALVPGSETVARAFRQLTLSGGVFPWSNDPYEYAFLSPNDGSYANVGVLVFNPRGRDYTEITPTGPVPLTARIDYDVLDWHIVREDRPMPGTEPFEVRLSLKRLKKLGDIQGDQTTYPGLFREVALPAVQKTDFLVYNLTTGEKVPPASYNVDYNEGVVRFLGKFGSDNAAGTFRFFYQAQGDWALQVQKAYSLYSRPVAQDSNVSLGQFYLGGGNSGGKTTRMYFPLTEAGKTVSVREIWYVDTAGSLQKVNNESFRINADRSRFEVLTTPGGVARTLTWLDLAETHTDAASWPLAPDRLVNPAVGVQGISFRARVMWKDGSTVQETTSGVQERVRWRIKDVDTVLTRSQN